MAIDRKQLPESAEVLQPMVIDLIAHLDANQARCEKTENLLRQLRRPGAEAAASG